MKSKTKKIKIISLLIISLLALVGISTLIMSVSTTSYAMSFNKPSQIIIYHNEEVGNQVYEADSEEYDTIYSLICNAYKQSTLKAFINGQLNKDIKIEQVENTAIDFSEIKVNFVYNNPQPLKYKTKIYTSKGRNYWYQNLIFEINSNNDFQYNKVYIIPPISDENYVNQYTYSLNYKVYSNFGKCYDTLIKYFK